MKKLLVLLMVLTMLLTAQAGAELLPAMGQLAQSQNNNVVHLLTTESYPEVCLSPYSLYSMYQSHRREPDFLRFPCPGGTFAYRVSPNSAYFIDMARDRLYSYVMQEEASFELFLNECADKSLIVADGGEGYAIYLAPSENMAYILVAAEAIAPGVKLKIELEDEAIAAMTEGQKVSALTDWAKGEAQRVLSAMKVERMDNYWSTGRFQGISLLNAKLPGLQMTYTIPEMPKFAYLSGPVAFISGVQYDGFEVDVVYGEEDALVIEIEFSDDYSHVENSRESDPESVFDATVEDGSTYAVKMTFNGNQECSSVYVSRHIADYTTSYGSDRTMYLTMKMELSRGHWDSKEAFLKDFQQIVSGLKVTDGNDVPMYTNAAPYPASSAADAAVQTAPNASDTAVTAPAATEVPAAEEAPDAGAVDAFTFRNGLHWGMTPEEVLTAEGQSQFQGQQQINDSVVGYTLPVKLSKFDVTAVYFFVNNRLAMVEFPYSSLYAGDADYLGNALEQVYGPAEKDAPILHQLATAIMAVRGNLDGYTNAAYGWFLPNGTAIELFAFRGSFDLFYADGTVDVDTVMATATPAPTPAPFDTNGL